MIEHPYLPITFRCVGCGREVRLPGESTGKQIVCPGCGLRTTAPRISHAARSALKWSPGAQTTAIPSATSAAPSAPHPKPGLPPADFHRSLRPPFITFALSGGVLLAITFLVSAVIPRRAQKSPSAVPSASRPDDRGADTSPVPADLPFSSPPNGAEQSIRVVKLEGRSEEELRKVLQPLASDLTAINAAAADDPAAERQAALVSLRMYRLLCGLTDDDLVLDDRLNDEGDAAAKVCRRLGYLTHEPTNPGLPDAEFAQARRGAGSGNLASGMRDLVAAVDGWMDDSDADNVAALGHRRWCLNPPLRRVGFGRSDRYFAMSAHDSSGSGQLQQPAICFPPPGCVPIDMFRPHYAWSVTLDPRAFQKPNAGLVKLQIRKLGDSPGPAAAIDLDFLHIDTHGYGIANCIIFRPTLPSTAVGSGYEVSLEGIRDHDGRNVRIMFTTQFIDPMTMLGPDARH